eukprot:s5003_g2.t1
MLFTKGTTQWIALSICKLPQGQLSCAKRQRNLKYQTSLCLTPLDLTDLVHRARQNLVYAETQMNKASSRSHAIFQLRTPLASSRTLFRGRHVSVEIRRRVSSEDGVTGTCSLLRVVDLAGSDRTKKSKVEGLRLKETNAINRSLLALGRLVQQHVLHCYWRRSHPSASELGRILLSRCPSRGNVVNALAFRKQHVPIRDSKLTLMLSDSLGGNCKTAMLVCVGPCASHAAETLSSLEFASRAMHIEARKSTHASTFCPVRPPSLGSRDMYKASPNRPKASASLQLGGPRGPRRRRLGFFGVIRPVVEGF